MNYKEQYLMRCEGNKKVINWINVNLANYLKKNGENINEIEHIIDYLKSDYAPSNIKGLQYKNAKINAQKWINWLSKKARNIVETEQDVKTIIDFKNGVKLVKLVGESAFKREGKLMSNCVASYYGKKDCSIYSLRDANNNPHCTIEVTDKNGYIQQIKGKGNGSIHPRYIKYVIKILKKLGLEVNSNELANLGYIDVRASYWRLLEKTYTNIKYITFNNKKYLYAYSNLKTKE